jgi:hypothetical protein
MEPSPALRRLAHMPDRRERHSLLRLLAVVVIAGMVAACTPAPSSPSSTPPSPAVALSSGVRGHVLAGPTCPVEKAGQSPCVRPVDGAVIVATNGSGTEIGRGTSDADGAFLIRLPAGTYFIEPQPVSGIPGAALVQIVTVRAGEFTTLELQYDTGIR